MESGQEWTIEGGGFGNTDATVVFDDVEVSPTVITENAITFTVPWLEASTYLVRVRAYNGFSEGALRMEIRLRVSGISTSSGDKGGCDLEVTGQGFNENSLVYWDSLELEGVELVSPSLLRARMPLTHRVESHAVRVVQQSRTFELLEAVSPQNYTTTAGKVVYQRVLDAGETEDVPTPSLFTVKYKGDDLSGVDMLLRSDLHEYAGNCAVETTLLTCTFSDVVSGSYKVYFSYGAQYAFIQNANSRVLHVKIPRFTHPSNIVSSLNGGPLLSL